MTYAKPKLAAAITVALTFALLGCSDKPEEGVNTQADAIATCESLKDPQPKDDSATARGVAVAEGIAARNACKNAVLGRATKETSDPNKDLARLRELAEKEDAEKSASKKAGKEFFQGVKEGGAKPLQGLKY
jgi:hypothetical protein